VLEVFGRDRADLGPAHAARMAADDNERYGPDAPRRRSALTPPRTTDQEAVDRMRRAQVHATHHRSTSRPSHGIGI
jgi:exodeoxyribonuclease V alpha subunit